MATGSASRGGEAEHSLACSLTSQERVTGRRGPGRGSGERRCCPGLAGRATRIIHTHARDENDWLADWLAGCMRFLCVPVFRTTTRQPERLALVWMCCCARTSRHTCIIHECARGRTSHTISHTYQSEREKERGERAKVIERFVRRCIRDYRRATIYRKRARRDIPVKKEEYRHRASSANARARGRYINGEGMRRGERRETERERSRARPIAVSRGSVVDETVVERRNLSLLAYVETRLLGDTSKIELTIVEDNIQVDRPTLREKISRCSPFFSLSLTLSLSLFLFAVDVRAYLSRVRAWSGSEHAKSASDRAHGHPPSGRTDARTYDTHARSDTKLVALIRLIVEERARRIEGRGKGRRRRSVSP